MPPVRPVQAARTPAEVGAGSADQSFQISGLERRLQLLSTDEGEYGELLMLHS